MIGHGVDVDMLHCGGQGGGWPDASRKQITHRSAREARVSFDQRYDTLQPQLVIGRA
jgi:hypothetical protein